MLPTSRIRVTGRSSGGPTWRDSVSRATKSQTARPPGGLTDFTSSESKLGRLLRLASLVRAGATPVAKVADQAARMLNLRHEEVFGRHLRLGERLGLLERSGERVRASPSVQALFELEELHGFPAGILSEYSKAYLAERLLVVAPYQLGKLLMAVSGGGRLPWSAVVISYFRHDGRLPWNHITVDKSLAKYERTGKVPRLFQHKVEGMAGWLEDLGAIKPSGTPELTRAGERLLAAWDDGSGSFVRGPVFLSGLMIEVSGLRGARGAGVVRRISRLIATAMQSLHANTTVVSYDAMRTSIVVSLLVEDGLAVEDPVFYEAAKAAWRAGSIRSIVMSREGKPMSVTRAEA